MIEDPKEVTFEWKICDLSTICKENLSGKHIVSDEFTGGQSNWRLLLYHGDSRSKDCLDLYLDLVESPTSGKKVLAEFWLVIKNQKTNCRRQKTGGDMWFSTTTTTTELSSKVLRRTWGWQSFMLLSELKRESSGFLLNDTILLQAKVKIKTEVTGFS